MTHIVIVPLVVARQDDGSNVYVYEGAPLPETVGEQETARLVEGGFVAEEAVVDKLPEGDPAEGWTVPQLRAYADAHAVDLGGARSKAEVLAALGVGEQQ